MNPGLLAKIETLVDRQQELDGLLADAEVINDQNQFRELSREYAEIAPVVDCYRQYYQQLQAIEAAEEMLRDDDEAMRRLASDELDQLRPDADELASRLQTLLLPRDPADNSNIYLEIRAGTGGDEAALFVGDLLRMYSRYCEQLGWQAETISSSEAELGGYREVVIRIIAQGAYSRLKFESGAHRVQRVPETESQGRIHTSACTVAVLPEADEITDIEVDKNDLREDTYRASGAGGQHVNKTDSAIRLTHLPTGLVVECQDERSQHKNRARAMSLLKARLLSAQREAQQAEQAASRKSLVGSGDRSERIRTYNFPQGRITDHRINLTLYKLDEFMQGNLDLVIQPLINEYQVEQLASLNE